MLKNSISSIRKMMAALTAILFTMTFTACNNDNNGGKGGNKEENAKSEKDIENIQTFKDAVLDLDNTFNTLEYEYDSWPDGGIRSIGGNLASLISLKDLEKMLPCPLYVSGPHKNGKWDLYNDRSYGHYNPEAVKYLVNLATDVVSDKNFVKGSRPLVDKYLSTQMHIMMVLHDVLYDEEMYSEEGREDLFTELLDNYGYCDEAYYLLNNLDLYDEDYIYPSYQYEFLNFWARRWEDGTIDLFYQGLSTIYKAYYPDYEYDLYNYYVEGDYDYWDGDYLYEDYYEETSYNCQLESDDPIANYERIDQDAAISMIKNATYNLDKSRNVLENEFDYWPECGLRITASHLFSLISLRTVNRMLPCDLYLYGPHYNNRWEFNNPYEYGQYNPEAIKYLNQLASKIVSDRNFVNSTKPLVEENLKRQMFILKSIYDGLNNRNLCPDKQAVFEDVMGSQGQYYYWGPETGPAMRFLDNLDINDDSYVYANTGNMFLYWWARRNADGTMELFHDGLMTIYNAYFPGE